MIRDDLMRFIFWLQNTLSFSDERVLQVSPWSGGFGAHLPGIWLRGLSGVCPVPGTHSRLPIQTGGEQVSLGSEGLSDGVRRLRALRLMAEFQESEGGVGNSSGRNGLGSWADTWCHDMW